MRGKELHEFISAQIDRRLGTRSWAWLARESDVPRSTLMTQKARPKFSLEVVVSVADTLGCELADLLRIESVVDEPNATRIANELPAIHAKRGSR